MDAEDDAGAFPLPDGVEDAELNKTELAGALGLSTNTIDRWVQQGCPVVEGGTNGKAYVFRLSEVWSWSKARDAAEIRRREQARRTSQQMQLHFLGLDERDRGGDLSLRDRRELAQSELVWMQTAERRRQLIQVDEAADLFEAVMGHLRESFTALPDRLARECGLTRMQTERAIELCDEALAEAQTMIERAELEERDLESAGEDRLLRLS